MVSMVYVMKNHDGALPTIKAYYTETDTWDDWGQLPEYSEKAAETVIQKNGYKIAQWNLWGHAEGFGEITAITCQDLQNSFNYYGSDMYDDRDDWVDDEEMADS